MTGSQLAMFVVFVPVGIAVLAVVSRLRLRARLAGRMRLAAGDADHARERLAQSSMELRGHLARALGALGRLMPLGVKDREKIVAALRRAGYEGSGALATVLGAKMACLVVGIVTGLAVLPPFISTVSEVFVGGAVVLLGAVIGGLFLGVALNLLPEFVVARLGAGRHRRIHAGFADAMDLLIVCLQAGMTFERAIQRTVANLGSFHRDLGLELRQASLDMSVHGRTRQDALERLARRVGSPEFGDFAVTVGQSERHGTPLAEALRKLASATRVQLVATMQAKLSRLPVLLILPTLAFVLPGILVIVGGPAFVELMTAMSAVGD